MILPIQVPPTLRKVSTAKFFQIKSINPSSYLACQLCCQDGGSEACEAIPGCIC